MCRPSCGPFVSCSIGACQPRLLEADHQDERGLRVPANPVRIMRRMALVVALVGWFGIASTRPAAEPVQVGGQSADAEPLDRLLDLYVRDGLVYYAALRAERAVIDRFVRAIADVPPGFGSWPASAQKAFWLNTYNALVLRTVIDHYPIRGPSPNYPTDSIRQIPGAFDDRAHQVGGREVTLDEIEVGILPAFGDPRVFLALGRGAVGSGRLRSEAYLSSRLDAQLDDVVREFSTTPQHLTLDRLGDEVRVSQIFGWRATEFIAAYGDLGRTETNRSPIERAILTLIEPMLFPGERAFLSANRFTLRYQEFDWRLNDLTGGRPHD